MQSVQVPLIGRVGSVSVGFPDDLREVLGEVADGLVGVLGHDALQACAEVGRPVVVVSNNAEAAIDAFLRRHQLRHLVQAVIACIPASPS